MNMYESFLQLLDVSEDDLGVLLPIWEHTCIRLGLTEKDMHFAAEEWLPQYWDLSLHGVRKCIAAYIRELMDVAQLDEYKQNGDEILYYNMPCHPPCVYAFLRAGEGKLHISFPDYVIATVFNAFFHKEIAESAIKRPKASPLCHQCEMNQVKVNEYFRHLIPEPTVQWNWGLYCNEGHKVEEYVHDMGERSWNYVLTTIPKDPAPGIPEAEDHSRVHYLALELQEAYKQISFFTGAQICPEDLIGASEEYLIYQLKVEKLMDMVSKADPQPLSGNDLAIFQAPAQIAFGTGLKYLNEAIDLILEEVTQRVQHGIGPLPKGAPRLACQFVPFSVPWINRAFMDCGVNLSINTFFAMPSRQQKYYDRSDIFNSMARQWLCNPSVVNMLNEADLVCEILEKYPQDGVLYGFFDFNCWIGSLQKTLIKIVESRTGIPHYYFESEFWNDEKYSLEDRMARIKSIAYQVKINHMLSGWNYGT